MAYKSFGLASLLVSALRSAVADPALQEQVDSQQAQIDGVRSAFDGVTTSLSSVSERVAALTADLASNTLSDADRDAKLTEINDTLAGVTGEMGELATALTGPRETPDDNGVIAEVAPVDGAPVSPIADEIAAQQPEPETAAEEGEQEQQGEQQE